MESPIKPLEENVIQRNNTTWLKPNEVLALHRLKTRKKALQARINGVAVSKSFSSKNVNSLLNTTSPTKRKNPFTKNNENKKLKSDTNIEPISPDLSSSDTTLFQLFNLSNSATSTPTKNTSVPPFTSFKSILKQNELQNTIITKTDGEKWIPIDWTLKTKLRLMSTKAFAWNKTLKTSEEASGITGFVRCLDTRTNTSLDTSPNAQFHQCCLYWQHPFLPWISLFPRKPGRVSASVAGLTSSGVFRESLQSSWVDSFRSLFQLVRARQCPYFYVCTNTFTAMFRAAGMCGYTEMHVMVTPTTRGFRQILKQEEIEFTMPLKNKRNSVDTNPDLGYDTQDSISQQFSEDSQMSCQDPLQEDEDEPPNEEWLHSMGVNADDIKKINYSQAKKVLRSECEVDNSEQSLIFIEGMETHAFYNFLINCKSIISATGPFAGIPPTLLSPVAFHGATLQSLKVRENKVCDKGIDYFSLELSGPVLPHTIHNLCSLLPKDCNMTATFGNITSTAAFCKINVQLTSKLVGEQKTKELNDSMAGSVVFCQENLSDCGLNKEILKHFCSADSNHIQHVDSLKYSSDTELYTWL